jgi:WD40 repeat protein
MCWQNAHTSTVRRLRFTATDVAAAGQSLVSTGDDGTVLVHHLPAIQKVYEYTAHGQIVRALGVQKCTDGHARIASGGWDRQVHFHKVSLL